MKIELVPLETKNPESVYHIEIFWMYGDGDHYHTVECDSEEQFLEYAAILKGVTRPDEQEWHRDHEYWIDRPCDNHGWYAMLGDVDLFYYNEYGTKFGVKLTE